MLDSIEAVFGCTSTTLPFTAIDVEGRVGALAGNHETMDDGSLTANKW
jgi:hypothetical protein